MLAGAAASARRRKKVAAGVAGAAALGFVALYLHKESLKAKRSRGRDDAGGKKKGGGRGKKKASNKVLALLLKGSVPSLAALAGLACARTLLANRLSTLQGGLFKTAFLRQKSDFAKLLGQNFLGCLLLSYLQSRFSKTTQSMEMLWRNRLTSGLHDKYFGDMNYYKCSHVDKSVANPEQIICEDVPKYCSGMAQCTGEVISSIVDVLFYSQRLSAYTRTNTYTFAMCAYIFGAGTLVKLVSPNFAKMYKRKQMLEGSYRTAQSRLRSNSESVAFYHRGILVEAETIQDRLAKMVSHNGSVLFRTWKFSMVQDFVLKYFGATFAVILIIGPFFEGHLRPENNIYGRAQMLSNMRYHTGVVISLFTALGVLGSTPSKTAKLKAYLQRIGELSDAMAASGVKAGSKPKALRAPSSEGAGRGGPKNYKAALTGPSMPKEEEEEEEESESASPSATSIVFKNATVSTPAGHVLIRDLNLVIEEGTNLLVTGPNGAGKSSLFRVLGGLWHLEEGYVRKPRRTDRHGKLTSPDEDDQGLASDIFYVPQKPYVSVGTLIEQLIYPSTLGSDTRLADDPEMLTSLLRQVDLLYLLTDFGRYTSNAEDDASIHSTGSSSNAPSSPKDSENAGDRSSMLDASTTVVNWSEVLSLGEQQRLGMARLFYHKPRFAILDECTSGVTNDMEERFCEIVEKMGCTCITISHRPALVAFHDKVLHLDGEGGWTLRDLVKEEEEEEGSEEEDEEEGSGSSEEGEGESGSNSGLGQLLEESEELSRRTDSERVYQGMIASTKKKSKSKSSKLSKHREAEQSTQHLGSLIGERVIKAPTNGFSSNSLLQKGPSAVNLKEAGGADAGKGRRSVSDMVTLVKRLLFSREEPKGARGRGLLGSVSSRGSDAVHLSALAACVILRTAISDRIANLNGQTVFYVINQDRSGFYKLMLTSALQSVANSVIASTLRYLTDHLALGWRERLTKQLLAEYFDKDSFYRAVHIRHLRDVDQRVTRDVERWCDDLAALVPCAIKPVLDAAWFSYQCYRLTGTKGIAFLYLYMAFGYATLKAVSPDLAMASRGEHDLESAFRQSHIALRERAESVAFFGGGPREKLNIHKRFVSLRNHVLRVLSLRFNHDFYEHFLTNQLPHNVTWIISMLFSLQYPLDISRNVDNQAAMVKEMRYLATVITQTFNSFGDILGLHKRCTELAGGATRIAEVFQEMRRSSEVFGGTKLEEGGDAIVFEEANIDTPSGLTLAKDLSLEIPLGKSLLISGPNASGKTSLVRCVAGLWPVKDGRVAVPSKTKVFFVTQKPYTTLGSLRAQILYPKRVGDGSGGDTDAKLEDLLSRVRLGYLAERWGWNSCQDWENVLSLGEQQRLGMARLFYHKPKFAFLDECTNAVSVDVEEDLYRYAKTLGVTMLTITQRSGLIEYHEEELKLLDGEGSWKHYKISL